MKVLTKPTPKVVTRQINLAGHILSAKVILSDTPKKLARHEAMGECLTNEEIALITSLNCDGPQVILNLSKYKDLYGDLPRTIKTSPVTSTCVIVENCKIFDSPSEN